MVRSMCWGKGVASRGRAGDHENYIRRIGTRVATLRHHYSFDHTQSQPLQGQWVPESTALARKHCTALKLLRTRRYRKQIGSMVRNV